MGPYADPGAATALGGITEAPLARHRARWHGLAGLGAAVRDGAVAAAELHASARQRITAVDPQVHAFTQVFDGAADTEQSTGPLAGLPIAVKDNIDVAGRVTGLGRPLTERPAADRDADVVARLRRDGAVVVGKTNLPEFACSPITDNPVTGATRNPHDLSRTAGGSSGGSAAAVAADMVVAALGTDTAGSVLVPAALTGICGLRPTHDAVSTAGTFPLSWSLDTVGVFAREPDDVRLVFESLRGDRGDREPALPRPRVGALTMWADSADPEIVRAFDAALADLRDIGCPARAVSASDPDELRAHARTIYLSEATAALADLPTTEIRYGADVEIRRTAGLRLTGTDYALARRRQQAWQAELRGLFAGIDVLVCPTAPVVAPALAGLTSEDGLDLIRFSYPFCFAGVPALSVPCRTDGLPVGLLLVAPWHSEQRLFELGRAYLGRHVDQAAT